MALQITAPVTVEATTRNTGEISKSPNARVAQKRYRRTHRGIHQPTRQRSDNLVRASRFPLLRAIMCVADPNGVQQHLIGVDHCIKRPSARCPAIRSPFLIIAFRNEAGNSSHCAIGPRISDQSTPRWIFNAPASATHSKSKQFFAIFETSSNPCGVSTATIMNHSLDPLIRSAAGEMINRPILSEQA